MLQIQCNIGGYNSNKPVTILAMLDNNILAIAKQVTYSEKRLRDNLAFIGNAGDDMDYVFTDNDFNDAINAYFERSAKNRITIDSKLTKYTPDNKLEVDKIDTSGKVYRIDPSVENGQIAVIVIALFAKKQDRINESLDLMQEIADIQNGVNNDVYSITSI